MELLLELLTTATHKPRKRTYASVRPGPPLPTMPSGVPAKAPYNIRADNQKGKAAKKPKARPKKNLWFVNQNLWTRDVRNERPDHQMMQDSDGNIYAVDGASEFAYGVWYQGKAQGVTFHDARPVHTVKPTRTKLSPAS